MKICMPLLMSRSAQDQGLVGYWTQATGPCARAPFLLKTFLVQCFGGFRTHRGYDVWHCQMATNTHVLLWKD